MCQYHKLGDSTDILKDQAIGINIEKGNSKFKTIRINGKSARSCNTKKL